MLAVCGDQCAMASGEVTGALGPAVVVPTGNRTDDARPDSGHLGGESPVARPRRLTLIRPDLMAAWRDDELPDDSAAVINRVRGAQPATG